MLSFFTLLMVIGAGIGVFMSRYYEDTSVSQSPDGLLWPNPKQLQQFTMVDQHGNNFTLADLQGKWSLLFFGYTHCPDVCPVTLSLLAELHRKQLLNSKATDVQTVFVTVDPARDTRERLAEFMPYFSSDFIGLGGTLAQLNSLASQIGVAYNYGPDSGDGEYLVDHTSSLFLLDPEARLVSIISPPYSVDAIERRFTSARDFISKQDRH